MEEIKKWQNMWQEQESRPMEVNKLIEQLNKIENNLRVRRYCVIVAALALAFTALFQISEFENINFILGYTLVGIAIAFKLFALYKGKYNLIKNEIELNNQSFIKNQIRKLKEKVTFKKKHLSILRCLNKKIELLYIHLQLFYLLLGI